MLIAPPGEPAGLPPRRLLAARRLAKRPRRKLLAESISQRNLVSVVRVTY